MQPHHAHHHAAPAPFEPPPVRVDGTEIPPAAIAAEIQHHPAADPATAWRAAAEALIIRHLLLREASSRGFDATPEGDETPDDAIVRRLLDAELSVPSADEATCRRWYAANQAHFRTAPAWHAQHVLIAADPQDITERDAARDQATAVLAEALASPERLADLARALSTCPSREEGGDLGLVTAGSTVPPFEAALAATAPGTVCPHVVETRYGFHVLRVLERAERRVIPFEQARPRIAAYLTEAVWRRAAHQYMALLASRAVIEGATLSAGADGPLVQ